MASGLSDFLTVAKKISSIRETEIFLPIALKRAHMPALMTGDDTMLRTSVVSPVGYDRELIDLFSKKLKVLEEDGTFKKYSFLDLSNQVSNIDKLLMLYGLYDATYKYLSEKRRVFCTNKDCKSNEAKNKNNEMFHIYKSIKMEELLHDDSMYAWDKIDNEGNIIPFYMYTHQITIPYDDFEYIFYSRIPSIKQNNDILNFLSSEMIEYNLKNLNSVFNKAQNVALITSYIEIRQKDGVIAPVKSETLQELLMAVEDFIPSSVSDDYMKKYGEEFDKYLPKFYTDITCPYCNTEFKFTVDIELEFLRRSLSGGE